MSYDVVQLEDLYFNKPVGTGKNSQVYTGEYLGQPVAIKQITNQSYIDSAQQVLESNFNSSDIVRIYGVCRGKYLYVVMEVMAKPLYDQLLLEDYSGYKSAQRCAQQIRQCEIAEAIVRAVKYLHHYDYVHGRLSLRNILVNDLGDVKLNPFGLSKFTKHGKQQPTYQDDLYGLGEILFAIFTGQNRTQCDANRILETCQLPLELQEVINGCLSESRQSPDIDRIIHCLRQCKEELHQAEFTAQPVCYSFNQLLTDLKKPVAGNTPRCRG